MPDKELQQRGTWSQASLVHIRTPSDAHPRTHTHARVYREHGWWRQSRGACETAVASFFSARRVQNDIPLVLRKLKPTCSASACRALSWSSRLWRETPALLQTPLPTKVHPARDSKTKSWFLHAVALGKSTAHQVREPAVLYGYSMWVPDCQNEWWAATLHEWMNVVCWYENPLTD